METTHTSPRIFESTTIDIIKTNFTERELMADFIEWTDEKRKLFEKAWKVYLDGKCSRRDVAQAMHCSMDKCYTMAKKYGLPYTRENNNKVDKEILKKIGVL